MPYQYLVYIMTNDSRTLYIGVTNDLEKRAAEHRQHAVPGFTARYNVGQLVYYEETSDIRSAIAREKEIKRWRRQKKVRLIESLNPEWRELAELPDAT